MSLKAVWRRLPVAALLALVVGLVGANQASAQAVLSGRVVDADGAPVAFAEISIGRLNLATATEVDGTYRLLIPAARVTGQRETVSARALGYRSETLEVTLSSGETTLDFTLLLDPLRLEGVVATGQALTQTRERLGYTVDTVDNEEIVQSGETNIVAALAGKAPGVWVTSSTGEAGGGSFINIRGWNTTLTTNQPLFVVDGTPMINSTNQLESSLGGTTVQNRAADLNPDDIESIEILKGPAATSIYGAQGANGVVLITTKSGQRGVTRFTGKVSYSWDGVNKTAPLQTRFGRGWADPDDPGTNLSPAENYALTWGPELAAGTETFDHGMDVFKMGHRTGVDLTLSGGSDRTTYYLSGSYSNYDGPIIGNNQLGTWSVRLKATQWIRDNLSVGGNFAYTNQQGDLIQQGSNISGLLLGSFRTPPEFNNCRADADPCYTDPDNGLHYSYRNPNPTSLTAGRGYDNPYFIAHEILNQTDVGRTFGNVRLDWQALDWLNASWLVGADYSNDDRFTLFPKSSSTQPLGRIIRGNFREFDIDNTLLFTGDHTFNENISGSVSLGYNMRQQEYSQNINQGDNLIFGAEELDFAADRIPNEFKSTVRSDGYFGELNADLYSQLFLSARVRNDGWSTFGPDTDSRFWYGSASASWTFTRMLNLDADHWLNFGKARVGYGTAGKAPNVYSNVAGFTAETFNDGWLDNGLQTIYMGLEGVTHQGGLANTAIKPEKTSEFEAGLELAFLNSTVSFSGVYYKQKTTDAIINVPLPPSTGFANLPTNAAEFENSGWEFTLDLVPFQSENFAWEIGGMWSTNDSRVIDICAQYDDAGNCVLGSETLGLGGFFSGNNRVVKDLCGISASEPCAFGVIWGQDFIRFGREDGTVVDGVNIDTAYPEATPGALYLDASGFPIEDPQERVIGDPNPDWLASIRNTFRIYRNLRVSFLVDFKQGGDTWNGTKGALMYFGTHGASEQYHGAGVQDFEFEGYGPGQGVAVDLNHTTWTVGGPGSGFTGPGSQFVENSSYTKLRDVSVTYGFDQPWVNNLGFNTIEVTLSGRNLKTWTDYTGIDPETNLRGQQIGRGLDYFNHPQTRSFILTFNFIR